jgi:hypothetical protein
MFSCYEFIVATHHTMRGTTHDHRTHGHIDEGIPQKLNLQIMEAQKFHQQFWKHLNMTNAGQNK